MSYTSLTDHYLTLWTMKQHHKWDIPEIEDLIPFERDIYADLIMDFLEKEKQRLEAHG